MSGIENTWLEILSENDFSNQTQYYNKVLTHVRKNYMKVIFLFSKHVFFIYFLNQILTLSESILDIYRSAIFGRET